MSLPGKWKNDVLSPILQEFFLGQFCVSDDFFQQTPAYIFSLMNGDNCHASIGMPEKDVAAMLPDFQKSQLLEPMNDLPAGKRLELHQTETSILWIPTN